MALERTAVDDVVELVRLVELVDVYLYEERGRRVDATGGPDDEPLVRSFASIGSREDEDEGDFGIAFRFRLVFDDRLGNEFVSDFQARYTLPAPCDITQEVRAEFAERVAFFAVYPYLRASIQMSAGRMGVPAPVLEMVRAGEFTLGDTMTDDEVESQFRDRAPEDASR